MLEHRSREPAPGVFRLVLPLPFPGLKKVNAYLLTDDSGSTLIDCGIYLPDPTEDHGWDDLVAAFEAAGQRVEEVTRLIVTHTHIDHYGMAARVVDASGCELWMHKEAEQELESYRDPSGAAGRLRAMLADHGIDENDLDELTAFEDWRPFVSGVVSATTEIGEGEEVTVGGRSWQLIYTPGHARSHVCLWTPGDKILVSGDHLLPTITPHIDFRRGADADPLGEFLDSLTKVESLDPSLVLPGHGHPFAEGAERARTIARHHDRRLGSILQIIRREEHTVDEITDEIWGEELLYFQRRLAIGEALAHLVYLVQRGEVEHVVRPDGTSAFRKVSRRRSDDE